MWRRTLAALLLLSVSGLAGWLTYRQLDASRGFDVAAAADVNPAASGPDVTAAEPADIAPPSPTRTIGIGRGDTLVAALIRNDVAARAAHEIAAALQGAGADLRRLRAGDSLELRLDAQAYPTWLAYSASAWLRFEAFAGADGWRAERVDIAREIRVEARAGEVEGSLWDAVDRGAVSPQVILDLVNLFESEFDFTVDTQPGDRFRLLVEARYADGRYVDDGRIVAAQYRTADGDTMTGIGFQLADGYAYYDAAGHSLRKMFLRSPLQFARISSGFTYRRPHPILGGVRPHLAIDYAAPTGTPVWAVADGTVEFAGRKGGNGIQVLLRHRAGYQTYYNHLSRTAEGVQRGARVKQKQVIGYVGSTGLSTGPHLDYRVRKDGRFVNPLAEKFLPGEPVPAAARAEFAEHAHKQLARLAALAPFASTPELAGPSPAGDAEPANGDGRGLPAAPST